MSSKVKAKVRIDAEEEHICTEVFRDVMHLKNELNSIATHVAGSLNIRGSEMAMIDTLGKYGKLTMSELAKACFFSPSNATYTVAALEKKQLLKGIRSSDSHRVVYVELTSEGKKLFKKSYPLVLDEVFAFFDQRLTKKERVSFMKLMHKLAQ